MARAGGRGLEGVTLRCWTGTPSPRSSRRSCRYAQTAMRRGVLVVVRRAVPESRARCGFAPPRRRPRPPRRRPAWSSRRARRRSRTRPGALVSSGRAGRLTGLTSWAKPLPVTTKPLASTRNAVLQPAGVRIGADEQEQMAQRAGVGLPAGALARNTAAVSACGLRRPRAPTTSACRVQARHSGSAAMRSTR